MVIVILVKIRVVVLEYGQLEARNIFILNASRSNQTVIDSEYWYRKFTILRLTQIE